MKFLVTILFALGLMPCSVFAATQTPPPGYEPSLPGQYDTSVAHLPEYLPNGAINLDQAWILYGGARLYWNSVYMPTQLKLAGKTWVDPALVPVLIPEKKTVRRKYYRPRRRAATKVQVPANVSSTALTPPGIPLPVTPVPDSQVPVPPLKPQSSKSVHKAKKTVAAVEQQPAQVMQPGQVETPRLQ